jgi:hypothetical protein
LNSLTSSSNAGLFFDLILTEIGSNKVYDKFKITSGITAGSILTIKGINLIEDGHMSSGQLNLFSSDNGDISNLTLDPTKLHAYSNNYEYTFANTTTNGSITFAQTANGGLANAVSDAIAYKSFSAVGSYNTNASDLGTMGGSMLTIFGNKVGINGNNHIGMNLSTGQVLNIFDVGNGTVDTVNKTASVTKSMNSFTEHTANTGSVVTNNGGTVNIADSVFASDSGNLNAEIDGGAIYNNSSGI